MGKLALLFVTAMLLLRPGGLTPTQSQSLPPPTNAPASAAPSSSDATNRILGFTAWDDDYLYIALQINKPTLNGKNSEPFSNPLEDDAAIISLQTDDNRQATQRNAHTFTVALSAAGGAQLYSGPDKKPLFRGLKDLQQRLEDINTNEKDTVAQEAKRTALLASLLKFKVNPQGATLAGGLTMPGYTLEVAIPWVDLGGKPEPGAKMGFNVAAQSTVPGSPPLQSLSPRVKGGSDLDNPSLWTEILFSNSPNVAPSGAIICARVLANKPVIDGELSGGEWNHITAFEFGERISNRTAGSPLSNTLAARVRPEFTPRPPRPAVPLSEPEASLPSLAAHRAQRLAPLVLARYVYWYQADTRKAAPAQNVLRPDGSSALIHHPLEGVGPWLSYDRADWHRRQLQEMRRAGIDVVLPVYRGTARDRQLYAGKGLMVLAEALNSLRQSGQDYPQVALYLDTSALIEALGDRPDLRDPGAQAALYGMIRDFYRAIPAPFRYVVPLTATNGGRTAYVVFLSDAGAFKDFDSTFVEAVRRRFAADFDGADLLILGESGFRPKAQLDGYFVPAREKGGQFNGDGWIKTASVSPGYDPLLSDEGAQKPVARSRRDGETYRREWLAALSKKPDWVLLDSWNDYADGTELAPTLETGFSYADLTRVFTRMFAGSAPRSQKFLWHDAPSTMLSGSTVAVTVRVQNTGTEGWGPVGSDQLPVAFAYRWRRGDQVLATGALTALSDPVLAGQDVNLTVPIRAAGANGAALPTGDYTLEISAVEASKKGSADAWIGDLPGSLSLEVPVKVRSAADGGVSAWAATLLSTDLPTTLESGGVYPVQATLRNDGAQPWRKADGTRVTLRLYRAALTGSASGSAPTPTLVATADATAELTEDVPPGQTATVRLLLALVDPQGKPLPVWSQADPWMYIARWEVAADAPRTASLRPVAEADTSARGVSIAPTPLGVVDFDFGVRFTADGTLPSLPAERRLPVRLSLQNVGPQTWKRDSVRVGYHWYYLDGTEYVFDDETTALPQDVPPGGKVTDMLAWITPPPYDGTYWLVWDVKVGDTWASTTASAHPFDQTVHQVQVIQGRLTFADLTKAYNLDGITDAEDLSGGNFDGQGNAFPSLPMPPFANTATVPSGIWLPGKGGPESERRISFQWGPKGEKAKNFIACQGQKIQIGKSGEQCRLLHIVAASTGKDLFADLKLIFQEPTSQSEDMYVLPASRWDRPPERGEPIAFLARRHQTRNGLQPGAVALYHYVIRIREPRKLIALQLPNAPEIKIAAITLEK